MDVTLFLAWEWFQWVAIRFALFMALLTLGPSIGLIAADFLLYVDQRRYCHSAIAHLPPEVNFVFFMTHLPLINDVQSQVVADLPEATELELRHYLEAEAPRSHAKFIVVSGHIHNYERFEVGGISYIVSGGGGAKPYPIYARDPADLYRDKSYPNFNYIVSMVHGKQADATMYRVADPKAPTLTTEIKERFTLTAK